MAVTHEAGGCIQLTAAGDQILLNLYVKRIRWESDGGAPGDTLEITDPTDNNKVIFRDFCTGTNFISETIIEGRFPFGLEVNVLGSGTVRVYYV